MKKKVLILLFVDFLSDKACNLQIGSIRQVLILLFVDFLSDIVLHQDIREVLHSLNPSFRGFPF